MYTLQEVRKSAWLSLVAVALVSGIGIPRASAGNYTYSLVDLSGYITTSCNNCVLNASNIIAWNMSAPGYVNIASTTPGALVQAPAGDTDMGATPESINFNFEGNFYGFIFAAPSGFVEFSDTGPNGDIGFGPGEGIVAECNNSGNCNFTGGTVGSRSIAIAVVPFAKFTAAAHLRLSPTTADSRFRLEGSFALGGQPKVLTPESLNLQLTVGSVALFLPAGSLSASGNGYEFQGPLNGGVLHLLIEERNGRYQFSAQGLGFNLTGTTIPVSVALVVGTDGGEAQLASGEVELSSRAE